MTVPRWMIPGAPLNHLLDGAAASEMSPIAARHPSAVDSDDRITHILLILSVTFASISVMSTLSALYWFVKMRRSFRHEQVPIHPGRGRPAFANHWQVDLALNPK